MSDALSQPQLWKTLGLTLGAATALALVVQLRKPRTGEIRFSTTDLQAVSSQASNTPEEAQPGQHDSATSDVSSEPADEASFPHDSIERSNTDFQAASLVQQVCHEGSTDYVSCGIERSNTDAEAASLVQQVCHEGSTDDISCGIERCNTDVQVASLVQHVCHEGMQPGDSATDDDSCKSEDTASFPRGGIDRSIERTNTDLQAASLVQQVCHEGSHTIVEAGSLMTLPGQQDPATDDDSSKPEDEASMPQGGIEHSDADLQAASLVQQVSQQAGSNTILEDEPGSKPEESNRGGPRKTTLTHDWRRPDQEEQPRPRLARGNTRDERNPSLFQNDPTGEADAREEHLTSFQRSTIAKGDAVARPQGQDWRRPDQEEQPRPRLARGTTMDVRNPSLFENNPTGKADAREEHLTSFQRSTIAKGDAAAQRSPSLFQNNPTGKADAREEKLTSEQRARIAKFGELGG